MFAVEISLVLLLIIVEINFLPTASNNRTVAVVLMGADIFITSFAGLG